MRPLDFGRRNRPARDLAFLPLEQQLLESECRTEADLDGKIVAYCHGLRVVGFRLLTYHTHDSRRSAAGFPDRAILIPGHLWMLELKVYPNTASPAQRSWMELLQGIPGVTAALVYPKDWPALANAIYDRLTVDGDPVEQALRSGR